MSKLLAGNLSAQFVILIFTPIITRLYTPNDYGIMVLVGSVVAVLSIFSCMRYETAIIIEREENNAKTIMFLCFYICIISTLVIAFLSYSAYYINPDIFGQIGPLIVLFVIIGYFTMGIHLALTSYLVRKKKYQILSILYLVTALITVIIKVIYGYFYGSNPYALLLASIPGALLAIVVMFIALNRAGVFNELDYLGVDRLKIVAKKHDEFPKYQVSNSLLNSASQNTIVLLLTIFFTPQVVGFYGLSQSVLQKPIKLIGDSFSRVYLQNVAELQDDKAALAKSLLRSTSVFALMGVLPFGMLMIWGEGLFSYVFGANWSEAGYYTQILAPWIFVAFVNNPSRQMIILLKKLRFNFLFQLSGLLLRVSTVVVLALLSKSVIVVIATFAFLGVLLNLYYIIMTYKFTVQAYSAA
ncbi:MAG: oligosaccharide flippase family protein [Desulfuromonadales bacterium]|nr:oligosaccharide flippase family protein [Desulfuromonadales bacterium]